MLKLDIAQNCLNQLGYSTPIAKDIKILAGGTNTEVYNLSTTSDKFLATRLYKKDFWAAIQVHEAEKWIAKHALPGFGTPTPYEFQNDNPYLEFEINGENRLISFQPFLGNPPKYNDKNKESFPPEKSFQFAFSIQRWIDAANYKDENGQGFEEMMAEKYDKEGYKFKNPYPVANYNDITISSLNKLMEVDPEYYAEYNSDFRRIAFRAEENYQKLGEIFEEQIINWDQCFDNSVPMSDVTLTFKNSEKVISKNFITFDNGEAGRGYEAIECAMGMMFACIDLEGGKGQINMRSAQNFIKGFVAARGKPFTEKEAELIFSAGAEIAVARWSTRRLEHQANLLEASLNKIRANEPIFTYEDAVEDFKQERDNGRFRGLDDLHIAIKQLTHLKVTGEYKKLFTDEIDILETPERNLG